MKNLDLNAYGVVEMNQQEMTNVDGGLGWVVVGALIVIGLIASTQTAN
jgi:lactobin A/cerein 7B family class IIb bacteriocin